MEVIIHFNVVLINTVMLLMSSYLDCHLISYTNILAAVLNFIAHSFIYFSSIPPLAFQSLY